MIADCTGLILAGGDSRRMGFDKTALRFGDQTMLQRVVRLMQTVFPHVLVSVKQRRENIDVPQVLDEYPDAGPLAGLCAGLAQSRTPWAFAVAADMPFLNPEVIGRLAAWRDDFQAVVPVIQGHPQPLATYYAVSALPLIRTLLDAPGKHSMRAALERLKVCHVHESRLQAFDCGLESFIDLDTPEDVAALKAGMRKERL